MVKNVILCELLLLHQYSYVRTFVFYLLKSPA